MDKLAEKFGILITKDWKVWLGAVAIIFGAAVLVALWIKSKRDNDAE